MCSDRAGVIPKIGWIVTIWFVLASCLCHAQGAATVIFVSGNAQIVGKDGVSRAAMRGAELSVGEMMDTAEGRAQLRFQDGASVSLQTATQFRVDEFRFADQGGKASAEDRGFFALLKGGFRTLTGLIGKDRREQYKVNAVVATIGIRGTDYTAQLGDSGLAVTTHGGLVEVCSDAGCALVAPGQSVLVPDRNAVPQRRGAGGRGGADEPLIQDLALPKPGESPPVNLPPQVPASPPTQGPSTAPPMQGPNYPPTIGPNLR